MRCKFQVKHLAAVIVGVIATMVTTKSQADAGADLPPPNENNSNAPATGLPQKYADLYGAQVNLLPSGEPLVRVGIAQSLSEVTLRVLGGASLRCHQGNQEELLDLAPGSRVRVWVQRATAAQQAYYLDLGAITQTHRLASQLQMFRARGLSGVMPMFEGTSVGIGDRMLDNRVLHVVLAARDQDDALARQRDLRDRLGMATRLRTRLKKPPTGTLGVSVASGAGPDVHCDNMFQLRPANTAPMEVLDVEFAKGYSWHGHANRRYAGDLTVAIGPDKKLAVINEIGAETFLQGVVPAEIYPSAPAEALKAQAVAARNTLLAKLGKRHTADPFMLCGEQHCQVYAGVTAHDPRSTQAVLATRGEVLFLRGRVVDAVYSASCGGHTEDNEAVWGDAPDPALRGRLDVDAPPHALLGMQKALYARGLDAFWRGAPTAFCKLPSPASAERFRWRRAFDRNDLQRIVGEAHPEVWPLRDVQVVGRGRGGRVTTLRLVGARHAAIVQRELAIRQLFANLRSAAFALQTQRDRHGDVQKLTFIGGGWGHGVGMCQFGAMGRAQIGHDYRTILAHYYNGAVPQQLYGEAPMAAK